MIVLALLVTLVWFGAAHARAAAQGASKIAARDQIVALQGAFESYSLDHSGYVGMTPSVLARDYGARLDGRIAGTLTISASSTTFCAQVESGGWYAALRGPSNQLVSAPTPIC